jgi:hypothetical protein
MKHKENLGTFIGILLAAFLVVGVAWVKIDQYLEFKSRELKVIAIDQCGKIATSKWQDAKNNTEVTETYQPAYEKCLKDKGY